MNRKRISGQQRANHSRPLYPFDKNTVTARSDDDDVIAITV
jgi:hypothetical protein